MTERAYYRCDGPEPFRAAILEIRPLEGGKRAVLLDKTIFYPGGGGQSSDRGTINGVPLLDVKEEDGGILHVLPAEGALVPGPAELLLDIRRRRDFTVQHTAQHLLSGTILRLTGKPTVSMHLGDTICTIDVDCPDLAAGALAGAEDAAAGVIEEDHPVIIHLCPPEDLRSFPLRKVPPQGEEVVRVVEIEGSDFSPCCGTHCASTGKIGLLRVLDAEKYKGMTRVTFIAGRRCLEESRVLRRNAVIISRALKTPVHETARGVLALLEKHAKLEEEFEDLALADAGARAEALVAEAGTSTISALYDDLDMEKVLRIGRAARNKTGAFIVLASKKDLKFAAFCGEKEKDLRPLVRTAMEKHGGRGGGGPGFFQGLFDSQEALRAFLEAVKASGLSRL